ncbi:hypothetical protein ACXZ9C_11545 [Streptococcus agalactiae]
MAWRSVVRWYVVVGWSRGVASSSWWLVGHVGRVVRRSFVGHRRRWLV